MLSTNTTSSIQRRRQLHRRQNSLEVPILVNPVPATPHPSLPHHRRGLSLDQSVTHNHHSFRFRAAPQLQEHDSPLVGITTNTGRPTSQHSMQAQLQRPAQPGYPMDQQHFLQLNSPQQQQQQLESQQALQAHFAQQQSMQQSRPPRAQALQDLNQHFQLFVERYGSVYDDDDNSSNNNNNVSTHEPQPTNLSHASQSSPMLSNRPVTPTTSFTAVHPASAPQRRVERPIMDVAPMPSSFATVPMVHIQAPVSSQEPSAFLQEPFGSEYGYASSYASSLADPSSPMTSPIRQNSIVGMPTLYEAVSPVPASATFVTDQLLLAAAASGASPELGYMADSPMMHPPMSPREMMLATLDIDASIEDTGISAEEVQQYISEQDVNDGKWTCLYDGCHKKFGRKENIKSHVQTHLGDRQFKCNHCGKCFVRQHDLKRHAKIHSGDKPHKCPCGNGFARQDALTRHRQRGVCEGALPGFERREVKRGRPRKARPDVAERIDKASRSRLNDRRGSEMSAYESSSPSDRSYPHTPPNASFDNDQFVDMDGTSTASLNAFLRTLEDTPATSPFTTGDASSPAKTQSAISDMAEALKYEAEQQAVRQISTPHSSPPRLNDCSHSPELAVQGSGDVFGDSLFDFGPPDAQPKVFKVNDAFSPTESSSNGSDLDHLSPEASMGAETFMGAADGLLDFNGIYDASDAMFQATMNAWDTNQEIQDCFTL